MSQTTDQAEQLRQQALAVLIAERQEIDRKLSQLGYDGNEPVKKIKPCTVCGDLTHTARFHKKATDVTGTELAQSADL